MKIVIKISDEDYKAIAKGYLPYGAIADAIRNGIPLPKNHGRLIDADALQTEMEKDVRKAMSFVDLKDFVWLAPTIIEAEVSE
jgi:hypothetical protein